MTIIRKLKRLKLRVMLNAWPESIRNSVKVPQSLTFFIAEVLHHMALKLCLGRLQSLYFIFNILVYILFHGDNLVLSNSFQLWSFVNNILWRRSEIKLELLVQRNTLDKLKLIGSKSFPSVLHFSV